MRIAWGVLTLARMFGERTTEIKFGAGEERSVALT